MEHWARCVHRAQQTSRVSVLFCFGLVLALSISHQLDRAVTSRKQITADLGCVMLPSWKVAQPPTSLKPAPAPTTQHRGEVMCVPTPAPPSPWWENLLASLIFFHQFLLNRTHFKDIPALRKQQLSLGTEPVGSTEIPPEFSTQHPPGSPLGAAGP